MTPPMISVYGYDFRIDGKQRKRRFRKRKYRKLSTINILRKHISKRTGYSSTLIYKEKKQMKPKMEGCLSAIDFLKLRVAPRANKEMDFSLTGEKLLELLELFADHQSIKFIDSIRKYEKENRISIATDDRTSETLLKIAKL